MPHQKFIVTSIGEDSTITVTPTVHSDDVIINLIDEWQSIAQYVRVGDDVYLTWDGAGSLSGLCPNPFTTRNGQHFVLHPSITISPSMIQQAQKCFFAALYKDRYGETVTLSLHTYNALTRYRLFKIRLGSSKSEMSKPMMMGNIVHEIVQNCSVRNVPITKWNDAEIEDIIQQHAVEMKLLNADKGDCFSEAKQFEDAALEWQNDLQRRGYRVFGKEVEITDPVHGLKGIVDILAKHEKTNEYLPIELKTGKWKSFDHQVQVQLYLAILANTLDDSPESCSLKAPNPSFGQLVYLKHGNTLEISNRLLNKDASLFSTILQLRNKIAAFMVHRDYMIDPVEKCDGGRFGCVCQERIIVEDNPIMNALTQEELTTIDNRKHDDWNMVGIRFVDHQMVLEPQNGVISRDFAIGTQVTIHSGRSVVVHGQVVDIGIVETNANTNFKKTSQTMTVAINTSIHALDNKRYQVKPVMSYNSMKFAKRQALEPFIIDQATTMQVVQGYPGAGKSFWIGQRVAEIIHADPDSTILLTAYTHSAVDNMIQAVRSNLPDLTILRLRVSDANEGLDLWDCANIIASTTLGLTHPYFTWKKTLFDYTIIDEASQMLEPIAYAGIRKAERTILAGDYLQLGPVVQSSDSILQTSLFEKMCLHHKQNVTTLQYQYRMNQGIQNFVNHVIYQPKGIKVETANDKVANNYLETDIQQGMSMQQLCESAVVRMHCEDAANDSRATTNVTEAQMIEQLVRTFVEEQNISVERIGIIAPYNTQVRFIQEQFACHPQLSGVEVSTVDKYQGREKDIIIVSFVHPKSILYTWQRLHVALTRAKQKLYLVGQNLMFDLQE